jgi:hypothetical protein
VEKIRKPKHSTMKIHLLGGISRKGLTPMVMLKKNMSSPDFQHYLTLSVISFIDEKLQYRHRLFMDKNPKHMPGSTREFLKVNHINHLFYYNNLFLKIFQNIKILV